MGRTNHLAIIKSVLTGMGRGCQICFAILKAIDSMIMPHITEPPRPPSEPWPYSQYPDKPPAKASKFPFLDYLQIGLVSIRERGELPVQVHASITLHCAIDKDKFGIGMAISQSLNAKGAAALTNLDVNVDVNANPELGNIIRQIRDWAKVSTLTKLEFNFELFSDPSSPTPFHGIAPARRVPAKLSSDRRRRLVKGWLDECTDNHWPCCQPLLGLEDDGVLGVQTWRPRRLLDLGDSPRTSIRLVDGAGTSGPYATVSHVWKPRGGSDLVLNKDTLPKLMGQRIRWRDLPPVVQDAVVIASEQDIRYLWLHALCVVQDDPQDVAWHVEQAHRTYGHSYLNIALERSTHLHETCLGTRWLDRRKGVEVQEVEIPVFKDKKPYKLYARPAVHHRESHASLHVEPTFFPYHRPRDDLNAPPCPLLESTAFLQEQILAPRTLHIGMSELAWECRIETGCECRPSKTAITEDIPSTISALKSALARRPVEYFQASQLWDEFRRTYIQQAVQKPGVADTDRLSPLIGLASALQPLIDKQFVAGLFASSDDDLASQLMWHIGAARPRGLPDKATEPGRWRVDDGDGGGGAAHVPSWSWASMVTRYACAVGSPHTLFNRYGSAFLPDASFNVHGIDNLTPPGTAPTPPDEPCLHAHSWQLRVAGKFTAIRIAARPHTRLYPSTGIYEFISRNGSHFPPPHPPAGDDDDAAAAAPPVVREIPLPGPLRRGADGGADALGFAAGDLMFDSDAFEAARLLEDTEAWETKFSWAHVLLLGRVTRPRVGPPSALLLDVDVGIVLREARGGGRKGEFERIGVFWLPAGQEEFFDETDVVLV